MRKYEIYIITNLINNKKYVGQTGKGYLIRFKEHMVNMTDPKLSHYPLYRAMNKYGIANFGVEIIESNLSKNVANEREIFYIKDLNTFASTESGYNVTDGGGGVCGYEHNDETKRKISKKAKAFWKQLKKDPVKYKEFCQKRGAPLKGISKSNQHRKLLSDRAKERVGEKNSFYNCHHKEETKQRIGEANSKKVGMYNRDTNELIYIFSSLAEATQYLLDNNITKNVGASSRISKICRGQDKTAYGYIWKFIE